MPYLHTPTHTDCDKHGISKSKTAASCYHNDATTVPTGDMSGISIWILITYD